MIPIPKLVDDWEHVLKRAWSVKFNIAAALFGGLEVAVSIWQPDGVPHGAFAGIAAIVTMLAVGARVMAQKEKIDEPSP